MCLLFKLFLLKQLLSPFIKLFFRETTTCSLLPSLRRFKRFDLFEFLRSSLNEICKDSSCFEDTIMRGQHFNYKIFSLLNIKSRSL